MSKHIQNLERLYQKMEVKYGKDDPLVMEFNRTLEERRAKKLTESASRYSSRLNRDMELGNKPVH